MSQITTSADIIPQLVNFVNSLGGAVESTIGAVNESRPANTADTQQQAKVDMAQAVANTASVIFSQQSMLAGSETMSKLSTAVGLGGAVSTAIDTLPGQVSKLSTAFAEYSAAVTSGDRRAISSAGLDLTRAFASVINSGGAIIASAAEGLSAASTGIHDELN